jgi:hypothetical protein
MLRSLARSLIYPGSPVPFPGPDELPRRFPGFVWTSYRAADGQGLEGVYARPEARDGPVVLYFHGNAESAAQNLPTGAALRSRGVGCFLGGCRGYGGLGGSPSEEGLYADGRAALRELARQGVAGDRVVLVGRSLGSGVAVQLATEGRFRALVLVSPYTSMVDMGRLLVGGLAGALVPDRYDNLSKLPRVTGPVTIFHGTRDEVIPFEMGERLARSRPGTAFVPLEGLGHNDIPDVPGLILRAVSPVPPVTPSGSGS